jgi:FixJ family two-component response regulator
MPDAEPVVFIVDDDASVRDALHLLVESAGLCAQTFGSGREFLSRPPALGPSCLILDMLLPDLNGIDVQKQLADRNAMPIIFITGYQDIPTTVRAMKAGAVEFLTKPLRSDLLLSAIRSAIDRSRAQLAQAAEVEQLRACYVSLSRREQDVMALIVRGRLNKQVGGELGISEITVKAHRGRMMRKMHAGSLPELVMMAATLRLVPHCRDPLGSPRLGADLT